MPDTIKAWDIFMIVQAIISWHPRLNAESQAGARTKRDLELDTSSPAFTRPMLLSVVILLTKGTLSLHDGIYWNNFKYPQQRQRHGLNQFVWQGYSGSEELCEDVYAAWGRELNQRVPREITEALNKRAMGNPSIQPEWLKNPVLANSELALAYFTRPIYAATPIQSIGARYGYGKVGTLYINQRGLDPRKCAFACEDTRTLAELWFDVTPVAAQIRDKGTFYLFCGVNQVAQVVEAWDTRQKEPSNVNKLIEKIRLVDPSFRGEASFKSEYPPRHRELAAGKVRHCECRPAKPQADAASSSAAHAAQQARVATPPSRPGSSSSSTSSGSSRGQMSCVDMSSLQLRPLTFSYHPYREGVDELERAFKYWAKTHPQ